MNIFLRNQRGQGDASFGIGLGIAAIVVIVLTLLFSTAHVRNHEVGIVSNQGATDVNQRPLYPGWHPIWPIFQSVDTISIIQQNHPFNEVVAASKTLQNVHIDGSINYHVDVQRAAKLDIQGGPDQVIQRVLWPSFQDYIKEIVPKYDTSDILNARETIRNAVKDRLLGKT